MAIEIKKQEKSNFGIYLLIFLILIIGGWFLFQFVRPVKLISLPKPEDLLPRSSYELSQATLNIETILNHPVFQRLTTHIIWPPTGVSLGKDNPFQPF